MKGIEWSRLWQPRAPQFWLLVAFNVLSSLCGWALRIEGLSGAITALLVVTALLNMLGGLLMVWLLLRQPRA